MQRRYGQLVEEHLSPAQHLAAGLRALPGTAKAFASTQAAWRFFENQRVGLRALMQPLIVRSREAVDEECDQFVLVMHDWSQLHYNTHTGKKDRIPLSQSTDLGYELQTALLVSDRDGDPLAPISLSLRAADGVHCSRTGYVRQPLSKLDELAPTMDFVKQQKLGKPAVHIIDREADSVGHYRRWSEHPQQYFLVRADDRVAKHQGQKRRFSVIHEVLKQQGAFRETRSVSYGGKKAQQWIAETEITLTQPARPHRRDGRPRRSIPGPPLSLRLVISEIRNEQGKVLAVWFLLTNVSATVKATELALWYYWRWRIESYFKLLKSAGQEVEHWQQETAHALAKRLLVASMACVVVWQLARSDAPEAEPMRQLLVRLSGRQMKRNKPFTAPALLAGLWVLLAMLYVLEVYHVDDLRRLAQLALANPRASPDHASKLV